MMVEQKCRDCGEIFVRYATQRVIRCAACRSIPCEVVRIREDWQPTREAIGALPGPVRKYVTRLEGSRRE